MQFEHVAFEGCPQLCASWALGIGDRAALAGPSKAGKSLQIQLISGEIPRSRISGRIVFAPEISRIAVLRRGWSSFQHRSVLEELTSSPPVSRLSQPQGSSCMLVDVEGAAFPQDIRDLKVEQCMEEFHLSDELLMELPLCTLLRVAVAKLMIWKPDVLLLDDVTDLEGEDWKVDQVDQIDLSACWMEKFLLSAGLKILLVASHDRSLMDKVCNRVIAIHDFHKTSVLEGNYGRAYLAGGDYLHFHSFSLWQPKSSGLRATQAACAFASLVAEDFCASEASKMVDVGTGTGILSLILAQQWQRRAKTGQLQVWSIELDEAALRIARHNFNSSPWADRIHTHHTSFQDWTPPSWEGHPPSFMCNPPYDDELVNQRAGTEAEALSRRRALERSFLPLEDLCRGVKGHGAKGCQSIWILWGNAEVPCQMLRSSYLEAAKSIPKSARDA